MAYRKIDRKRYTYLLSWGADDFELRKFFSDCRLRLIQHGAKVQNLPSGTSGRIRALASEMPTTTDEVVGTWFAKNLTMIDPEEIEAVIGVFKRYEEVGEELPDESARRYARSCLVHLFSREPSSSLLEYLRTPIGGSAKGGEEQIEGKVGQPEEAELSPSIVENLPQVLVDLVEGKDADEHLEGLPATLVTFIGGLQAAAQGQLDQANDAIQALPAESSLRWRLEQFLRKEEARTISAESSRPGLQVAKSEPFEGAFDVETDEILGYCSNAGRETAVFVRPIAAVRAGQPQMLSDDQRRRFFPETGDVIAFPGIGQPRQPTRGDIGVWRVAEHETDKATHFHLASDKRPVYEVRLVPFSSVEYDSVREYLREHARRAGVTSHRLLLFQLSDGVIVAGRTAWQDLSRDETFESGLLAWNSLPALRFEGQLLVIGPLPEPQFVYECGDIASTVRKLFRPQVVAGKLPGGLSKGQLRDLAQSLESGEVTLDALRVQRIKTELEHLWRQQEAFDALVAELINYPALKLRVDQLVEKMAEVQAAQKLSLQADIVRLQKERAEWEERVHKQQAEHRKLRDETSKLVKAAFEKARADGVSTLAEVAVFQALSAVSLSLPGNFQKATVGAGSLAQPSVRELAVGNGDAISILRSLGVPNQRATAFAALGGCALRAGLVLSIGGIAARQVVEAWTTIAGRAPVSIEATIGQIDDFALKAALAKEPPYDALGLLNGNLSALDLYARPISDLVLARLTKPEGNQSPACLIAMADGVASLPMPRSFEKISVSFDLDRRYSIRGESELAELMSLALDPDEGSLYARLWPPAADRLRVHIEVLEPEARAFALSILAST